MSEAAVVTPEVPVKSPVKVSAKPKKKPAALKKAASHPTYNEMVVEAIKTLKERGGSSRHAILAYIQKNYAVGDNQNKVNASLKLSLKKGVESKKLKQVKGTGASGSFRIGEVVAVKKNPVKARSPAKKVSKPKSATPKKVTKKAPAKKLVKAVTKKPVAKKPAAKKPVAVKKSPAKKPVVKKATKKPAAKKPATKSKKPAAKK